MTVAPANDLKIGRDLDVAETPKASRGTKQKRKTKKVKLFARKGEAAPLVDKKGGAEAPEETVAVTVAEAVSQTKTSFGAITIINERSEAAGYPDNPTPDELEEIEAEQTALLDAAQKAKLASVTAPLVDVDLAPQAFDAPTEQASRHLTVDIIAPETSMDGSRKAMVSVRLTVREFLRLKLGAAELGLEDDDLIALAVSEYLDRHGVESLDDCHCLSAAAAKCEAAIVARAEED